MLTLHSRINLFRRRDPSPDLFYFFTNGGLDYHWQDILNVICYPLGYHVSFAYENRWIAPNPRQDGTGVEKLIVPGVEVLIIYYDPVETDQGHANQLFTIEQKHVPHLKLVKIGCPGDTTESMLTGHGNETNAKFFHCDRSGGSQLTAAEQFRAPTTNVARSRS